MRPAQVSRRGHKEGAEGERGCWPRGRVMVGRTWEMVTGMALERAWGMAGRLRA